MLVVADAVTTLAGLHVGAVEANPVVAGLPPASMVTLGIVSSLIVVRLLRSGRFELRLVAMAWLAVKGAVVASNLAVLLSLSH